MDIDPAPRASPATSRSPGARRREAWRTTAAFAARLHASLRARVRLLRRDRRAGMAIFAAATLPVPLSVAAFVVDLGHAYVARASLQQAADAAALAGALAYTTTASTSSVSATITSVVTANGWASGTVQAGSTGYLTHSPQNAANKAVQVSLKANAPLWFGAAMLNATTLPVVASSLVEIAGSKVCILSLTQLIVNSAVDVPSCGIAANSSGASSVLVNGSGNITASSIDTAGTITNNGTIVGAEKTGITVADPFASTQSAASGGFTSCQNYNNQSTITPGCWSNVNVNSGTLTLQSGTYYFTGININSGGSLSATASGGTTVITQNNFSPSGNVTITAPTSGTFSGIALYALGGMNINSGVGYTIDGAIYSPSSALIPDSGTWNQNACTTMVAQSITFNSGASFTLPQSGCSTYGYVTPAITTASLTR